MTTANEGVPCELFDRPRVMRYDFNAFADLEITTGKSVVELLPTDMEENRVPIFGILRAWVWAGLKWEDRTMTLPRAGDLISQYVSDGGGNQEIMNCILGALEKSEFFKKQADPGGNGQTNFPVAEAKEAKAST